MSNWFATTMLRSFFVFLLAACGGGGGGGGGGPCIGCGGVVNDPNPGFEFIFEGFDNNGFKIGIVFIPDLASAGMDQGNFNPVDSSIEYYSDRNSFLDATSLSGSFDGRTLTFTRAAGDADEIPELETEVSYTGRFITDDRLQLTRADDSGIVFDVYRNRQLFQPDFADNWSGIDVNGDTNLFQIGWTPGFSSEDNTGRIVATRIVNGEATTFSGIYIVDVISLTSIDRSESFVGTITQNGEQIDLPDGLQLVRTDNEGEGRVFFNGNSFSPKLFSADLFGTNIVQLLDFNDVDSNDVKVSPDGSMVAFRANNNVGEPYSLYVLDTADLASSSPIKISPNFSGDETVGSYEWWPDSGGLTYSAGRIGTSVLFSASAPNWTPLQLSFFAIEQSSAFWQSPTDRRTVYLINFGPGNMSLRIVDSDDADTREAIFENADIRSVSWDRTGRFVSFLEGDQSNTAYNLQVYSVESSLSARLSQSRGLSSGVRNYGWSENGEWIAFTSNVQNQARHDLYIVATPAGNTGQTLRQINTNLGSTGIPRVTGFAWSPISSYIAFVEPNVVDSALTDLKVATTSAADPVVTVTTTLNSQERMFGDLLVWGNSGNSVAFLLGEPRTASMRYEAYDVSTGAPPIVIAANMGSGDLVGVERGIPSPDSSGLLFRADTQSQGGAPDIAAALYVARFDGADIRRISSQVNSWFSIENPRWVDGSRIIFDADLNEADHRELFVAYVGGGGVIKVSDVLGRGRKVNNFDL